MKNPEQVSMGEQSAKFYQEDNELAHSIMSTHEDMYSLDRQDPRYAEAEELRCQVAEQRKHKLRYLGKMVTRGFLYGYNDPDLLRASRLWVDAKSASDGRFLENSGIVRVFERDRAHNNVQAKEHVENNLPQYIAEAKEYAEAEGVVINLGKSTPQRQKKTQKRRWFNLGK